MGGTAESLALPVTDALRRLRQASGVTLAFGGLVAECGALRLSHFVGATRGVLDGVSVDIGQGLGGKVIALSRPMVVDDYLRTPRITHRYNAVIAAEGLRAMAAAPVIVDRAPVAVIYGALHTGNPIGDRALDALAVEARDLEQRIVAARSAVADAATDTEADALRARLTDAFAQLRVLTRSVDDADLAGELRRIADTLVDAGPPIAPAAELTGREQDVLSLAALGYGNARIATDLGIGVQTVKGYVKDAMRKLSATSRLEAVVRARRAGLLP